MSEATFPKAITDVVSTIIEIFRHQREPEIVELLENAHARFDLVNFDNWNGGTSSWALRLEVPVRLFATLEPRLTAIEEKISSKLKHFSRQYPNDLLDETTIIPLSAQATALGARMAPSETEVRRLWPERRFRLFLSHLAKNKVEVSALKKELEFYGVAAFVAHEDIIPSLEWQREIELGLKSMHAMAALLTPDFHLSNWTDQEIGWAYGRGILVLPVRLGMDPYGFAAKVQGVAGSLDQLPFSAAAIVEALLINEQTQGEMRRSIINAFAESGSFSMTQKLRQIVGKIEFFSEQEKALLWKACTENDQIYKANGVIKAIYSMIGQPPALSSATTENDPSF